MSVNISVLFRIFIIATFVSIMVTESAMSATTIHVDNQNPAASDSNSGTSSSPLKTIQKAATMADKLNRESVPVTVLVHPGMYRERVSLPFMSNYPSNPAEIVFEAVSKGTVIVSGSDIWTGWNKESQSNTFSHSWSFDWGPANDEANEPIVWRREMVFMNGKLLRQVLSFNELQNDTFFVNESANKIYIKSSTNPNNAKVEVAIRSGIFVVNTRKNVTIRGFVFQHDTTRNDGSAVQIINSSNITIEDNVFRWNNWGGLRIFSFDNVTVRRCTANNNGGRGTEAVRGTNLVFEDIESSYNNWRGFMGNYTGHSVAGSKHLRIHGAKYRNLIAIENKARGFWLDFDSENIVFDGLILLNNLEAGISLEANQGPIEIRNSVICDNTTFGGLISSNSENVSVLDSVIFNNTKNQFRLFGASTSRSVSNFQTGKQYNLYMQNWTINGNIIGGSSTEPVMYIVDSPADRFLDTLTANNNLYWNPTETTIFRANGESDLNGWRSKTGQEKNSVFANPDTSNLNERQKQLWEICKYSTPGEIDNTPPTVPTVLTAIVISDSQINLSWGSSTDDDGVTGYRLYRNGSVVATVTDTYYSDTGLAASTKYSYTVTAIDALGNESDHSSETSATTYGGSSGSPPQAPSNLEVITPK